MPSSKSKTRVYLLLAAAFFIAPYGISGTAEARDAPDRWSKGDIASLFPPAPDGWRASGIELDAMDTPTSELERFANAFNENFNAKTSVRLKAIRHYKAESRKISITIDTDDIDSAINIDAMLAALESDDQVTRSHLEKDGFSTVSYEGRAGIGISVPDKIGRAFKVGSAGVIALECSYFDCTDILDSMITQIDFNAVVEFVGADHWYRLDESD